MSNLRRIISQDTRREDRVPPGQTIVERLPVLHQGTTPHIDPDSWRFGINGLVEKERILTYREFVELPQVEVFADIHCVTGWSKLDNLWEGVSTAAIRDVVNISPSAKYVIVRSVGGYSTNLTLKDFFEEEALFALKLDGSPLLLEHGYPVRCVLPHLYFWKSAKWVTGIEFTAEDRPGFWETRGYHNHGDPWKEERYSY